MPIIFSKGIVEKIREVIKEVIKVTGWLTQTMPSPTDQIVVPSFPSPEVVSFTELDISLYFCSMYLFSPTPTYMIIDHPSLPSADLIASFGLNGYYDVLPAFTIPTPTDVMIDNPELPTVPFNSSLHTLLSISSLCYSMYHFLNPLEHQIISSGLSPPILEPENITQFGITVSKVIYSGRAFTSRPSYTAPVVNPSRPSLTLISSFSLSVIGVEMEEPKPDISTSIVSNPERPSRETIASFDTSVGVRKSP
jgi:hypothetical protein